MKQPGPLPNRQMNLLLVTEPSTTAATEDRQKELTLAIVELLTSVAQASVEATAAGEDDERPETHS